MRDSVQKENAYGALMEMKIHECRLFNTERGQEYHVVRVPTGWIYQYVRLDAGVSTSVFVPLNI